MLGWSEDGPEGLSEEQRQAHIHIIGTTREGKSKLLEKLIRHDIDNGYGATLLDPSDNGDTAYNVLKYCISKGFEKVCLIDPNDAKFRIPCINPLAWKGKAATDAVVSNLMESTRVLWGQSGFESTPRIEEYLYAVFAALYNAKASIPDAQVFRVKVNIPSEIKRNKIIRALDENDSNRILLEAVFTPKGNELFIKEFQPSIRRLSPFFHYLPKLIFGSTGFVVGPDGKKRNQFIDFKKLISEKWVVLVNLDKTRVWGTPQQKMLGTLIINEIVNGIFDLRANGWRGQHYLYIDEVGQYATRVLSHIMAHKGKSGLWATVSHQFYSQVEDKEVLDAIENLCNIKIMFAVSNTPDRQRMARDMYTSELREQATDATIGLRKQYAHIKINKNPPVRTRIDDVFTPDITAKEVVEFKKKIYKLTPDWYRQPNQLLTEINNRFDKAPTQDSRPNATRPNEQVRPERPGAHASASGVQDRPNNQASTVQDAPLASERGRESSRKNVQRKKGFPDRIIRQHKQDDEPVGG